MHDAAFQLVLDTLFCYLKYSMKWTRRGKKTPRPFSRQPVSLNLSADTEGPGIQAGRQPMPHERRQENRQSLIAEAPHSRSALLRHEKYRFGQRPDET